MVHNMDSSQRNKWTIVLFFNKFIEFSGARGRNRTTDTRIFNPLLYP